MYSLYSSCVSKSQRPRGPFLLPCRERTAQSSSSVAGRASHTALHTQLQGFISHQPQIKGLGSRSPSLRSYRQILWKRRSEQSSMPVNTSGSSASDTCLLPDTTGSRSAKPKAHSAPSSSATSFPWHPLSWHWCLLCWLLLKAGANIPDPFCCSPPPHRCPQPYHPFWGEKSKERVQSGSMRWNRTLELVGIRSHCLGPKTVPGPEGSGPSCKPCR